MLTKYIVALVVVGSLSGLAKAESTNDTQGKGKFGCTVYGGPNFFANPTILDWHVKNTCDTNRPFSFNIAGDQVNVMICCTSK
jgi:hypothetical protein